MWDGLLEINWKDLTHAYGSAADVPRMLLALASHDDEIRYEAFEIVYGNIFHQGDRYEATPYAVPFLLEILREPGYPAVEELLTLLAFLVVGYDSLYIPDGFAWEIQRYRQALAESLADPERQDSAVHLQAIVDITDEVRKGVADYVAFLGDEDPEVSIAAAYLLAFLPESYSEFSDALLKTATTAPAPARGNALVSLALALADDPARAPREPFQEAIESDDPFLRATAAMGLAILGDSSPEVIAALLGVVSSRAPLEAPFPWYLREPATVATLCLGKVGGDDPETLIDALEGSLASMSTRQASSTAGVLMDLLFPTPPAEAAGVDPESLTATQRRWLTLLSRVAAPWEFPGGLSFGNFSLLMHDYGLPSTRPELVQFLAERRLH